MQTTNRELGIRIENTDFRYLTEGAYGLIFVDDRSRLVRKIYRNRNDANYDHCAAVFNSEILAYEIACRDENIQFLVPGHYRRLDTQAVIDKYKTTTNLVHPDLGFEMEYIEGNFCKIAMAPEPEGASVKSLFYKAGIRHLSDMSFIMRGCKIDKVIAFAVEEIELFV